jgi:hypothetical protein
LVHGEAAWRVDAFFRQLFAENQNLWYREFYKMDSFEAVAAPGPVCAGN